MRSEREIEKLKTEVESIKWYHTMDLGDGIVTKGNDDTPDKLSRIGLPEDLSGKTVLDIGAWDGAYAFEAERRGARRVVALDHRVWCLGVTNSNGVCDMSIPDPEKSGKRGFLLARRILNSKVEDVELDAQEMSPENPGVFDIVLFLGILYHVRHPLLSLERVASVTRELLILESYVALHGGDKPILLYRPLKPDLGLNPPNVWAPNPAAIVAMLTGLGFKRIETVFRAANDPDPAIWNCRPDRHKLLRKAVRAARNKLKKGIPFATTMGQIPEGRVVIHASR